MSAFAGLIQTLLLIGLFVLFCSAYLVERHPNIFLSWMAGYIVFICIWAFVDDMKRKKKAQMKAEK